MKRNLTFTNSPPRKRLALLAVVLGFAVVAGACSSGGAVSQAPTSVAPPTPSTTTEPTPIVPAAPVADPTPTVSDAPSGEEHPTPTATSEATTQPDSEQVARGPVDDILADLEDRGFVGSVMVQSPEQEWSASYGLADRAEGIDNQVDTIFDIGSISKQFTAAAILRLEMDGHLSVDDTIGQYVNGLTPQQGEMTLHQLLTHTSGLPHGLGPDDEAIALPDYIARIADEAVLSTIDEPVYSNVGYSLLGAVIETVTNDSYEVYLRNALFEPAGMMHTGYVLPDWTGATIAVGYDGEEVFGRPNEQPWADDGPWWNLRANGGLLSSIPDLLLWDEALRGNEILDATAKQKMYAPHVAIDSEAEAFYGYGWVVVPLDGATLITHAGGNNIFFAEILRIIDHDITIVLATNTNDPADWDIASELVSGIAPDPFEGGGVCQLEMTLGQAAAAFELVADYPDTPAGRAMADWVAVVLSGTSSGPDDEAMLLEYVEQSIGVGFLDEEAVEEAMDVIHLVQAGFDGFVVNRIYQQDAATFHVVVTDAHGGEALISAGIGAEPESRVACLGFSS